MARSQYREAVRLFLLDCRLRNLSPFTIQNYHTYLESLQHDMESWQLTLVSLQPKDLSERMIQHMLRLGFATNTINGRIRTCQQFFKFLYQEGILAQNVALGLKPLPKVKTMLHTFSESQLQAILLQPDQNTLKGLRDYALMLLLLDTGMRVNELTDLRKSDVDLDENYLRIHAGKNRKARRIPFQ
jgi:integrase/recombinase XerD